MPLRRLKVMKMTENMKIMAARLDKESLEYLNKLGSMLKIDKSSLVRQLIHKGIEEDKKERAIELYSKGKLTLEGASKFAGIYIGDFMELMREKGIESNVTLEMVKKSKPFN